MSEFIRHFRQKVDDSTYSSPVYLGAYPQYVGALRKSHNANLEEQLILGADCITTETWGLENEAMVHSIVKEFHDGEQSTDYYKLTAKIYDEVSDFDVNEGMLVLGSGSGAVSDQKLILGAGNSVNDKILTMTPVTSNTSNFSLKRETLSYINSNGEEIKISTKTTTKDYSIDNTVITKEIIEREENVNGNN